MKTKILYLESSDSTASVCDKMTRAAGSRILLVPPARSEILKRRLDLQIIRRRGQRLGSEIALITRDHLIQEHARNLDIPVFQTLRVAQSTEWNQPIEMKGVQPPIEERLKVIEETGEQVKQLREKHEESQPVYRKTFFSIGATAFLAVLVTVLPRAEIHLRPMETRQEIQINVRASEEFSTYNLSGDLPIYTVSIIVEGRDSLPTSGVLEISEGTASGEVAFINLSGEKLTIPEGTRLISSQGWDAEFATTSEVALLAVAGATATVPITALNPGEEGNVPAGAINVVDGPLGLHVSVSNPEATNGGSQRQGPGPSERDYIELRERLIESLWQSAIDELKMSLVEEDFIISSEPLASKVLQEQFTPEEPQAANRLSLHMQIEFQVSRVSGDDLTGMLTGILDRSLPTGFEAEKSNLVIEHDTPVILDERGSATWNVTAYRYIQSLILAEVIREQMKGLPAQKVEANLSAEYNLEAPAKVKIFPSWWPIMPLTPLRIQVFEE